MKAVIAASHTKDKTGLCGHFVGCTGPDSKLEELVLESQLFSGVFSGPHYAAAFPQRLFQRTRESLFSENNPDKFASSFAGRLGRFCKQQRFVLRINQRFAA